MERAPGDEDGEGPSAETEAFRSILVQVPGPRKSADGLPQATMNMTLGVNIQDNLLKNGSGGAFYPVVYPRTDAIEEVSVTSAASGAESLGEGAVQIKFVTRSGTNEWHGGAFIQERNTFLNANTYFNNIDGLARGRILPHQIGAHTGGPLSGTSCSSFSTTRYSASRRIGKRARSRPAAS
jgi:hypothetical protein